MVLLTTPPVVELNRRRFTVAEFQRMGEAGIFRNDERAELIDGEIVQMNPIGSAHAGCVKGLNHVLSLLLGNDALLGVQDPIVLGMQTEPQPDITVLRPRADSYASGHPGPADICFLIEVADSSLACDRAVKLPMYARAEIAEVWLVDVGGGQIERHTEPRDGVYRRIDLARRGDTLAAASLPQVTIEVEAVLGPAPDSADAPTDT